ncbi:MAG: hypothetical protein IPJ41_11590 [Phycisphaerales bacterium]|nr:hypothetical protein [Phycisphaerales bacterium]
MKSTAAWQVVEDKIAFPLKAEHHRASAKKGLMLQFSCSTPFPKMRSMGCLRERSLATHHLFLSQSRR